MFPRTQLTARPHVPASWYESSIHTSKTWYESSYNPAWAGWPWPGRAGPKKIIKQLGDRTAWAGPGRVVSARPNPFLRATAVPAGTAESAY